MPKLEKLPLKEIKKAAQILKSGGIVIFPTDTVYGIGCRFDDQKAIERLYKIKNASKDQKFPILVSSVTQAKQLAKVTHLAENLIEKYWPGALTIVLESSSGGEKIGLRMPDSKLIRSLVEKVGTPIIGTSANIHGQKPPKSFEQLDPEFTKLADFVIKEDCELGVESTVVDATVDPLKILRQGAVEI